MTKEIYHEGWLIKSPPTKRIWRARWRRRWFTLKQGEIPEQFCLEYYTDRNCRKLKGVIDLDQCEQVDSGLRLEHRKQKFQHMFDVKTPRRTYYLAADTEEDMNVWVNCICQLCNLQDLSKQQANNDGNRQYYNIGSEAVVNQPVQSSQLLPSSLRNNVQNTHSEPVTHYTPKRCSSRISDSISEHSNSVYQNYDPKFRNSSYDNRETMICDVSLTSRPNFSQSATAQKETKEDYYNFIAISNEANKIPVFERSQSMRTSSNPDSTTYNGNENGLPISHGRTQSLVEKKSLPNILTSSTSRKIPENLNLNESFVNDSEPSPALSTSSGPYIAISECISGNPLIDRDNPSTPLNSLDPKFYDTPRSHINIGLNLTNEQPYSPKRNNCPTNQARLPRSGRSSPTDSESVFTDDEDWVQTNTPEGVPDRNLRPSDSSIENDSIVFTYAQRFSKLPSDEFSQRRKNQSRRPKPVSDLLLEEADLEERNKETNSSDTENASPAITYGPKDNTCFVEESYDIPRSHHLPYYNLNNNSSGNDNNANSPTLSINKDDSLLSEGAACSTPIKHPQKMSTLQKNTRHFYTNAAPTKVEGNVFRYDFDDNQPDAPIVDRKLKPSRPVSTISMVSTSSIMQMEPKPPCIDRKLKPSTPLKLETNSLRRRGGPSNLSFSATTDTEFQADLRSDQFSKTLPRNYNNPSSTSSISSIPSTISSISTASTSFTPSTGKQIGKLDYFDLDHSNPPPICKNANTSASTSNLSNPFGVNQTNNNFSQSNRFSGYGGPSSLSSSTATLTGSTNNSGTIGKATGEAIAGATNSGIVYKSVDFIKTEAFMRTRQDAELNRAKNRVKEQK